MQVEDRRHATGTRAASPLQQLVVNSAEAAVTHHEDVIAGVRVGDDRRDEGIEIAVDSRLRAKRRERDSRIPAKLPGVTENHVGAGKACRQRVLHGAQLHRVRPRLQHRDDARGAHCAPQAFHRGRNGRRMVREIVIDGNASRDSARLEPALDAFEFGQRGEPCRGRDSRVPCRRERGKRVQSIVPAELRPAGRPPQVPLRDAAAQYGAIVIDPPIVQSGKPKRGVRSGIGVPEIRARETLDLGPEPRDSTRRGRLGVHDETARPRHRADEMMELRLDGGEVREDVGVRSNSRLLSIQVRGR